MGSVSWILLSAFLIEVTKAVYVLHIISFICVITSTADRILKWFPIEMQREKWKVFFKNVYIV